ncbi:MAG: hypothetical protein LBU62_06300 [Bacteroidales bacterium]|jgi:DNA-directed RNA polymerase subunit RPC12/RpoP/exonuclease VII small subunit|nr:hypothetical protein [Bacteroidales bacterium]
MPSLKLDLLQNGLDSLNEALCKYQEGKNGNDKAYKFCIQHLSHFFELILKYYVTLSHPLLIYKNPFAQKINQESQTIGLHEAINFLKNEGLELTENFESDLKWLKKLRNSIEHHTFEMNIDEVNAIIGRLMSAVVEFDESHESIDISSHILPEQFNLFHDLANTYQGRLNRALVTVREAKENAYRGVRHKEWQFVDFCIYNCDECGHETMIPDSESETGYKCTFCGNKESEDIKGTCGICGQNWPAWQLKTFDWDDEGHMETLCPYCLHHPEYRNDD